LDYAIRLFLNLSSDPIAMRQTLIVAMALAIFLFGAAIYSVIAGIFDPVRRRIELLGNGDTSIGNGTVRRRIVQAFEKAAPAIVPKSESELTQTGDRLLHAGYRSPSKLAVYYGIKTLLLIGLPALVFLCAPFFPKLMSVKNSLVAAGMAAGIGMLLPSYFLDKQIAARQKSLTNGFPDALDLLVVCTEAGLGLNAALQRVAQEIGSSHFELAEELNIVNAEIRAGVDRVVALRNLAKRAGLEEIRGLVALLAQSLTFGTSVADALRVYAEEFRDKRMQLAEEQAAKLGTKMIFPMVLCFFPGFFIVAVGPAALKLIEVFSSGQ
jgi:tight adherence protein C